MALGPFEMQVLQVVMRYPRDSYGISILGRLEEAGRRASVGALYTTLERLEKKGFVRSQWGEKTPERGGRAKRYYQVTGDGAQSLQQSIEARASFDSALGWEGGQV